MGLRRSHIASSKPVMSSAAIIHAGAAGAPPRAAASLAASACDTAYAVSASNLRHALRHSCGVSITAFSSSSTHSVGSSGRGGFVRSSSGFGPWSSSSGSWTRVDSAASIASCRFCCVSASCSVRLEPGVPASGPGLPSRDTARSPSTRTASRCARLFAAATSSVAFHVLGNPRESFEKTRANAVFISSTAFSAASRVLASTTSRTRVAIAAAAAVLSSAPGSKPFSASCSALQWRRAEVASTASSRSHKSSGGSSMSPVTWDPTARSIVRSHARVASPTRVLRSSATHAARSFSKSSVTRSATARHESRSD